MAITYEEKCLRLKEKLKDPVFYAAYRKKRLDRQRQYARDPEFCKRRNLSTADWRFRKARGLPTRPRGILKPAGLIIPPLRTECVQPKTEPTNYEFTLVSNISVAFD
jgi:hypothetical protein